MLFFVMLQDSDYGELHPLGGEEQDREQGLLRRGGRLLEATAYHSDREVRQERGSRSLVRLTHCRLQTPWAPSCCYYSF